jgi:hypothetical protein
MPIKKISLEFHDASLFNMQWEYLERLHGRYPEMKLSLFYIPWDYWYERSLVRLNKEEALEKLKENLDWIKLYPHGLTHFKEEFKNADKRAMKLTIASIEELFGTYKLPYEKGFCAPYWLWNQNVVDVLDKAGWWAGVNRDVENTLLTKKYYKYSHSIHEPFWADTEASVWKLHGHMDMTSNNDLEKCFFNLLKIPQGLEWHYIEDFVEENK